MRKVIYYNLKEASYLFKQLTIGELFHFEKRNPQLIPIPIQEKNIDQKLVNTLNQFFRD